MNGLSRPDRHRTAPFNRTHLPASKPDLERDSGFSDASSGYLSAVDLTDSEDVGRNGPVVSQEPPGPQVAVMGGSYAGLSPMIIMNNFVLKQPSTVAPTDKQWGFPSPMEVMPQSQVVLLQPMVPNGSSSSPKTAPENLKPSKGYMPILKSYPRIAPQPANTPTKRAGSSRARVSSASVYEQRQRRHHHGHRLYSSPSPQPALQSTVQPTLGFEAVDDRSQVPESQEQLTDTALSALSGSSSLPLFTDDFRTDMNVNMIQEDKDQDAFSVESNKLKRFSNTYNILNKSGLLGITMRTKQLIKDNKRTQGQLQQLQEQTALLLEALNSGDPQLWTKLQLSLQHSDKEQWAAKAHRVLA